MAKFCIYCGAPLNGNKFCTQCGKPVQAAAQPMQPAVQPASKKGMGTGAKVGIIAAACVLGVGAGVALAILQPWAQGAAASSEAAASASSASDTLAAPAETSSSDEASNANQTTAQISPNVQSSTATSAGTSSSSQESNTSSSSEAAPTEVNVNVNINSESADSSSSAQAAADYIIADSATRQLSRSELEGMSSDDLSRAQNEIWARHGRKFKNQWLQDYFDAQSWYSGTIAADDFTSQYKSTDVEDANASLISGILSERGWDVNRAHPN